MTPAPVAPRTWINRIMLTVFVLVGSLGIAFTLPANPAGAEGAFAAGLPQPTPGPGGGWNGGFTMPFGLGFCITPSAASPVEAPAGAYGPIGLPGGGTYTAGELGALMYFANQYAAVGYNGYDANTTSAVIASLSKDYGGGDNLPAVVNQTEKAQVAAYITAYPGPWSINITMPTPDAPGGTYQTGVNHSGNVQILAANGTPVSGLTLNVALGAGLTNFIWNNGTVTDAIGNLGFTFNVASPGGFSALIAIQGGAPAAVPASYGGPGGSGYQDLIMAGATTLFNGFNGTAVIVNAPATVTIQKSSTDPNYLGNSLGGAVFQVLDSTTTVIAQATTNAAGTAGPMQVPAPASYTIHESVAPPGMTPAPDQAWSPASGEVVTYHFVDPVTPVHLVVHKVDSDTHLGLAGAHFTVAYDPANTGTFSQPVAGPHPDGSFTTDATGVLVDPSGALTSLAPGTYLVTETVAPPTHVLP